MTPDFNTNPDCNNKPDFNNKLNCYNKHFTCSALILGVCLALGLSILGYFIGHSYLSAKQFDRIITAKELSERIVTSDFALWSIGLKATGNDLIEVSQKIDNDKEIVTNFLIKQGFDKTEIELGKYNVTDLLAQPYRSNNSPDYRYIISSSIELHSGKIDLIKTTTQKISEVVKQGVVLESMDGYSNNSIRYEFTKLNDIKPEMLAEANKNAYQSAQQFAGTSGSKIGKIRKVNQGIFVIEGYYGGPTDAKGAGTYAAASYMSGGDTSTIQKKVRIVPTIESYLVD